MSGAPLAALRTRLKSLAATIEHRNPWCTGTRTVPISTLDLWHGTEGNATHINLARATQPSLARLSSACSPATFGRDSETVLDKSYRKAGALNPSEFATKFSPESFGFRDTIRFGLLDAVSRDRDIRMELYKLNVYGNGSFFKPHQDTPRGVTMFGSLVVIFPTPHTGGSLLLHHKDTSYEFDSGKALSPSTLSSTSTTSNSSSIRVSTSTPATPTQTDTASIAYAAFYSDVSHEVTPVTSGHRITLTYNLYFDDPPSTAQSNTQTGILPDQSPFESTLTSLLSDPTFLPSGGTLAFGLNHQYPLPTTVPRLSKSRSRSRSRRRLGLRSRSEPKPNPDSNAPLIDALLPSLKGTDAHILQTLRRLGLLPSLYAIYDDHEGHQLMLNRRLDLIAAHRDGDIYQDVAMYLKEWRGGKLIKKNEIPEGRTFRLSEKQAEEKYEDFERLIQGSQTSDNEQDESDELDEDEDDDDEKEEPTVDTYPLDEEVHWVTPLTKKNEFTDIYVSAYGNECFPHLVYGDLALIVRIGPVGNRSGKEK